MPRRMHTLWSQYAHVRGKLKYTSLLLLFRMPRTRSVRFFSNILDAGPFKIPKQGVSYAIPRKSGLSTAFSTRQLILPH